MYMGTHAFANCSELSNVYCWAENPPVVYGMYNTYLLPFNNSYVEYTTLHVPEASINAYWESNIWNGFGKIVALTPEEETGVEITRNGEENIEIIAVR